MYIRSCRNTKMPPSLKGAGVGVCSVFFFQAEDGIRDLTVTGVQTCALPICAADQRLELEAGSPEAAVLEQQPGFKLGVGEPELGIDRYHLRIDVHAYGTGQQ